MSAPVALERFVGPPLHASRGGGGIAVHEGSFEAGGEIPVHVHDAAVVSLIVRGVASEQISSGTQDGVGQSHPHRDSCSGLRVDARDRRGDDAHVGRHGASAPRRRHYEATVAPARRRSNRSVDRVTSVGRGIGGDRRCAPTHLLRTFRRCQGATIANFVRQRRIQRGPAPANRASHSPILAPTRTTARCVLLSMGVICSPPAGRSTRLPGTRYFVREPPRYCNPISSDNFILPYASGR
jgi:hypothetical protein